MPYGHSSHQVGLDADIWLELSPKPALTVAAREDIAVPSLVLPDESGIDPARWTARHAALIRLAADTAGRRPDLRQPRHQARAVPQRSRRRLAAPGTALARP